MTQYIDKSDLVAKIEGLKEKYALCPTRNNYEKGLKEGRLIGYIDALDKINSMEVKDPYEQCIQYPSIEAGIKAPAETYSFNIESELFNQLTKEQQTLWRKEIEQAIISGGEIGVELAKDLRYKENLKVKKVDSDENVDKILKKNNYDYDELDFYAQHFFELGG